MFCRAYDERNLRETTWSIVRTDWRHCALYKPESGCKDIYSVCLYYGHSLWACYRHTISASASLQCLEITIERLWKVSVEGSQTLSSLSYLSGCSHVGVSRARAITRPARGEGSIWAVSLRRSWIINGDARRPSVTAGLNYSPSDPLETGEQHMDARTNKHRLHDLMWCMNS